MATENFAYLSYPEAVALHIELMRYLGETRYGVFDRALVESALARPRQAATYEQVDLIAQAATLLYGLIKNHPWVGGNKRTATFLTDSFLNRHGLFISVPKSEFVELALAIEADRWQTAEIAGWLRQHTRPLL
ncbi:MAG: type II toxin-antitoxin system death-on-curing family toxin [Acidobacteriota bacterium]|nr:type II toxin-antitoxin system death-on-curing family toxin [Acidobacteriota bacterium]